MEESMGVGGDNHWNFIDGKKFESRMEKFLLDLLII